MAAVIWLAPVVVVCLWHTIVNLDGSGMNMWKFWKATSFDGLRKIWPMPSFYACKLIFTFAAFEALLQIYVPGERHIGIVSPTGNHPVYKKNGFSCCLITLFVFYFAYKEKYFAPAGVYDHLGEIYSALIIIALVTCNLLFLKGYTYPSSTDWGSTGNVLVDFYWGLELYPRMGKDFDLKLFFNSRFGMMGWCCLIICFLIKQVIPTPE
jgi:7-dehydrocholesterol reductase